jgi:hypothetical protein
LASLVAFGFASWEGFVDWAVRSSDSMYSSAGEIEKMQSVSALLLLLELPADLVKAVQVGVVIACAGFVWRLWRSDAALEYKGAGLALVVVLATPYSFHYDLTLVGLAVLWLAVRFQIEGWRRWDVELLFLGWLSPLVAVLLASFIDFTVGPFIVLLLLLALHRRTSSAGRRISLPALASRTVAV